MSLREKTAWIRPVIGPFVCVPDVRRMFGPLHRGGLEGPALLSVPPCPILGGVVRNTTEPVCSRGGS